MSPDAVEWPETAHAFCCAACERRLMAWVKLDDAFFDHPKMRAAGKDGRALFVAALCHSGAQLLDGKIADSDLTLIAAKAEVRAKATATGLVAANLWHKAGHVCDRCPPCPERSYLIHDYHAYQPSAEQERKRRREVSEAKAAAGRKGAAARWGHGTADGKAMADGMAQGWHSDDPDPEPDPPSESPPAAASVTPARRQALIDEACRLAAEEKADTHPDHVGQGWINAAARGMAKDHHQALHAHLSAHPDATADDLLEIIRPTRRRTNRPEPSVPQYRPVADILAERTERAPSDELTSNVVNLRAQVFGA